MLVDIVLIDQAGLLKHLQDIFRELLDQLLGQTIHADPCEPGFIVRLPRCEEGCDRLRVCHKLGMREDGRLDLCCIHAELAIARTLPGCEEFGFQGREDLPVVVECLDIAIGDTTQQMRSDIVQIFRLGTVDIARNIQIVRILLNLGHTDHTRILRQIELAIEHIHNLMYILVAQTILVAILHIAFTGIDHKDTRASRSILLVQDDNAGRDTGAVEEVGR